MRSTVLKSAALLGVVLLVAACASQPAPVPAAPDAPGFFMGVLHGFIAPVALVVSIFKSDIRMYAYPNAGLWYDFGFLFGVMLLGGAGAGGSARRR